MEQRAKAMRSDNRGPCEYLDPQDDGRMLCGLYLMQMNNGRKVRAGIMARHLHFGHGCTYPGNERRRHLEKEGATL